MSGKSIGPNDKARIEKVAKAVEGLFAGQLMSELGKGMSGTSDAKEASFYQDFIQQAMSQQITSGSGLGLAHMIENYLNQSGRTDHPDQTGKTTPDSATISSPTTPLYRRRIE